MATSGEKADEAPARKGRTKLLLLGGLGLVLLLSGGVAAAWFAGLLGTVPSADAKFKCSESSCTDPTVVATVRDAVEAACTCEGAANAKRYKQCFKPVLKQLAKELGPTAFPKACQKEMKRALSNSRCGRPGYVLCRKTSNKGAVSCKPVFADKCADPFPPIDLAAD